jgi:hypothetical protein
MFERLKGVKRFVRDRKIILRGSILELLNSEVSIHATKASLFVPI